MKQYDDVDKYLNNKITKLYNRKSMLITMLKNSKRNKSPGYLSQCRLIQEAINVTKDQLKKEFAISCRSYWAALARNINHKDSMKFFSVINKQFRNKSIPTIQTLSIPESKKDILIQAKIKINECERNEKNVIIIQEKRDILNVIAAQYASVNKAKISDPHNRLHQIIERFYTDLNTEVEEFNRLDQHIIVFSNNNRPSNPSVMLEEDPYFISNEANLKIFRKLNNKTSSGIDKIPNIVLKHLPAAVIAGYTIIFNNCNNNLHYPEAWKTFKVIPIPKKDKDLSDPSSYRPVSLLPNISEVYKCHLGRNIEKTCKEIQ